MESRLVLTSPAAGGGVGGGGEGGGEGRGKGKGSGAGGHLDPHSKRRVSSYHEDLTRFVSAARLRFEMMPIPTMVRVMKPVIGREGLAAAISCELGQPRAYMGSKGQHRSDREATHPWGVPAVVAALRHDVQDPSDVGKATYMESVGKW